MTVRPTPVALFLIEIVTPGITAPLVSVTVPESVAPVTCAFVGTAGKSVNAKTKQTARRARNTPERRLIVASRVPSNSNAICFTFVHFRKLSSDPTALPGDQPDPNTGFELVTSGVSGRKPKLVPAV